MASVKDAILSMERNIEAATGKSVATWVSLCRQQGFAKHGEMVGWLKDQHGVGHGYANQIAKEALKPDSANTDEGLVAIQFSGNKAALRPLYEAILASVATFGADIEIAPKKNNVSLRRSKQFALLQASTATRLDVGLILKGVAPTERLEVSGSFNAMFTHRVRLTSIQDIDEDLRRWLRQAYDAA